jgi:phage-related protein
MTFEVIVLEPAADFLRQIEMKLRAKAFRAISLLQKFGPNLPMPHARKLSGYELHELRIKQGSNICRLFYFGHKRSVFVVTSGYVKKRDETDKREIERALRLKAGYIAGEKE